MCPWVRDWSGDKLVIRERHAASEKMLELSTQLIAHVLCCFAGRGVSLALDSSTVWQRYVACVVQCGEESVVVACVGDGDEGFLGEFTAEKISAFVGRIVHDIRRAGSFVFNTVTDNGSNFLKAATLAPRTFSIKCIAHGVNILVAYVLGKPAG